jgi:hypothetical protein
MEMYGQRITMITVGGAIHTPINLENLFNNLPINDNIIYCTFGKSKTEFSTRGVNPKPKKKPATKRFDNQLTILYKYNDNMANIKVFKNGQINIVSITNIDYGYQIIYELINIMKLYNIGENIVNDANISFDHSIHYKVDSIMTIGKLETRIRRDWLYNFLISNTRLRTIYETNNFVKIRYFVSIVNGSNTAIDGVCQCIPKCEKNTKKKNKCYIITFKLFEMSCGTSGSRSLEHLNKALQHIYGILRDNIEIFKRPILPAIV